MEIFRHIRENHLTEIKQLKIKIGKPPNSDRKPSYRKPGPKSRTIFRPPPTSSHLITELASSSTTRRDEEEMDFESTINSLSDLSEASDIKKKSEQEIVLTHKESSVTLLKEDFWDFKFLILFDYF